MTMADTSWRDSPAHPIVEPIEPRVRGCTGMWADVGEMGEESTSPNAYDALQAASYLLWVMSGRRYGGICRITEIYTCGNCCGSCTTQVLAIPTEGGSYPICRDCGYRTQQDRLFLRNRPARKIVGMSRHGIELDREQYAIYDYSYIARWDMASCGGGCWDPCGTEVTYEWGTYPPTIAKLAVLEFAKQFVKAVECPEQCRLPERVTSVSRQGVSFQIFDPQDFMNDGRTGLYAVDIFLKTVNPDGAQRRARIFSPDMPQAHQRTWPKRYPKVGGRP